MLRFGIWQLTSLYNYFYITSSAELCIYFHHQILKYSLFAGQVQTSARAASERTSVSLIRERPLFFAIWQLRLLYNCCYITSKTELCSNLRYSLFAGQVQTSARAASERTSATLIQGDVFVFGIRQLELLHNYFFMTSKAEFCSNFRCQILKYSLLYGQVQTSSERASPASQPGASPSPATPETAGASGSGLSPLNK